MSKCVASGCNEIGTYDFPKNPRGRVLWENAINIPNFKATDNSRLCHRHFKGSDFSTEYFHIQTFDNRLEYGMKLKDLVVPSIFHNSYPKYAHILGKKLPLVKLKRLVDPLQMDEPIFSVPIPIKEEDEFSVEALDDIISLSGGSEEDAGSIQLDPETVWLDEYAGNVQLITESQKKTLLYNGKSTSAKSEPLNTLSAKKKQPETLNIVPETAKRKTEINKDPVASDPPMKKLKVVKQNELPPEILSQISQALPLGTKKAYVMLNDLAPHPLPEICASVEIESQAPPAVIKKHGTVNMGKDLTSHKQNTFVVNKVASESTPVETNITIGPTVMFENKRKSKINKPNILIKTPSHKQNTFVVNKVVSVSTPVETNITIGPTVMSENKRKSKIDKPNILDKTPAKQFHRWPRVNIPQQLAESVAVAFDAAGAPVTSTLFTSTTPTYKKKEPPKGKTKGNAMLNDSAPPLLPESCDVAEDKPAEGAEQPSVPLPILNQVPAPIKMEKEPNRGGFLIPKIIPAKKISHKTPLRESKPETPVTTYHSMKQEISKLKSVICGLTTKLRRYERVKLKKENPNYAFQQVTKNMTNSAQIFTRMQMRVKNVFSLEEKILALSLFQKNRSVYQLMAGLFRLPSRGTLRSLAGGELGGDDDLSPKKQPTTKKKTKNVAPQPNQISNQVQTADQNQIVLQEDDLVMLNEDGTVEVEEAGGGVVLSGRVKGGEALYVGLGGAGGGSWGKRRLT